MNEIVKNEKLMFDWAHSEKGMTAKAVPQDILNLQGKSVKNRTDEKKMSERTRRGTKPHQDKNKQINPETREDDVAAKQETNKTFSD